MPGPAARPIALTAKPDGSSGMYREILRASLHFTMRRAWAGYRLPSGDPSYPIQGRSNPSEDQGSFICRSQSSPGARPERPNLNG
jgi:hypothetical protein